MTDLIRFQVIFSYLDVFNGHLNVVIVHFLHFTM